MRKHDGFRRGQTPVFDCVSCGRSTRVTNANSGTHCCPECDELAAADNSYNDNDTTPSADEMKHFNTLLSRIAKKGGDAQRVKADTTFIFNAQTEHPTLENTAMSKTTKNTREKSAPSRSAESRRERRIIRNWFKAATRYAFVLDEKFVGDGTDDSTTDFDALKSIIADFEAADTLLATVAGYEGSSFIAD